MVVMAAVTALGTVMETAAEAVGDTEAKGWETYVTSEEFHPDSSVCLLGGLSICLPNLFCVCEPVCVSSTCVSATGVSE